MANEAAPACSLVLSGYASTPRVEKKVRKSTTGPCRVVDVLRAPAHSTATTFFPARSAACMIVSACRTPEERPVVRLLKLLSPILKKVLLVEPCSPGYVPVAGVY